MKREWERGRRGDAETGDGERRGRGEAEERRS